MRKNPWVALFSLLLIFFGLMFFLSKHVSFSLSGREDFPKVSNKDSILRLELDGVIMDGRRFLKSLKKYREDEHIKAIVVEVDSPGGVVGPSQEIHDEILRTREVYQKPVVMVTDGMMASGAYYAAVAADKIVTAPGAMVGSIGVIMEFMNLEKLYDWAKVSRYTINTGKYKDSGSEYRAMRPDERQLFQELINDVFVQFKQAVEAGRDLKPEFVDKYADGRVFTGRQAVEMGFADELGTIDDAYDVAADLANLEDYEIFEIPKRRPGLLDMIQGPDEEDDATSSLKKGFAVLARFEDHMRLQNQPLLLMPGGAW